MNSGADGRQLMPDSSDSARNSAIKVLVDAVRALYDAGDRPPTASEVRLEMKRLTFAREPGLSAVDTGPWLD